jgi:uncharacterized protein
VNTVHLDGGTFVTKIRKQRPGRQLFAVIALIIVFAALYVWIDRLFGLRTHVALGYGAVYSKNMIFELSTRYGGALVYMGITLFAIRPVKSIAIPILFRTLQFVAAILGFVIGYGMWSLDPTTWFLFFHHQQFPMSDPIFHLNESFYIYSLPILLGLLGRLIGTVILFSVIRGLFLVAAFLRQKLSITRIDLAKTIHRQIRILLGLLSFLFVCFAALSLLSRYVTAIDSSKGSYIFGPDFVTAKLTLPIFSWLHIALLLLVAFSFAWLCVKADTVIGLSEGFSTLSMRAFRRPLQAFGLYVASIVLTSVVGGVVGALYVHPNESTVEIPYIKNTIDATRWAFGIDKVDVKPFMPGTTLSKATVDNESGALKNVRINDQQQTTTIYDQLQSFKSYFQFTPASVDRYNDSEVYVSARQMDDTKLPVQTWINQTLVYTHGYGLAVSPVNEFDENGLPTMWAKDTPQTTQSPIPSIKNPNIYFGLMNNSVIAPSKQSEFDFPVGSDDHVSHYQGGSGLPVIGNRWLLALEGGSLKFFTSDQITPESQWLFDRNIYSRVADIAPFLRYDQDAFPFIDSEGHIDWMLDAYTQTNNIPYAQQFMGAKYIRNSVKVVMDAYTGKTTFYVIDKSDPMIQSLMKVYPTLFTTDIPTDISAHFRYPNDLFQAQSSALTRYHMTDASSFYNQEDLWDIAQQIYQQNQTSDRPPVYQMVRLPDRPKAEFILSELFTPHQKQNLNGWFVADNEQGHYGQLTVYQFPQDSLVFGPMQAENQIDSNPTLSSQLSLWNQQGSHVVRGDLLLIPVGNTILYVEPIYLVANRDNSLPQLERVIIDFNQQVYFNTSLGAAMNDLLNATGGTTPAPNVPAANGQGNDTTGANQQAGQGQGQTGQGSAGQGATGTAGTPGVTGTTGMAGGPANSASLISQANQLFGQYEADTAKGDFEAAGKDLKQLGDVLSKLKGLGQTTK